MNDRLAALQRERDELAEWKCQMMQLEAMWNQQAVGKLLGVPMGVFVRPEIEPRIRALIAERDRLKKPRAKDHSGMRQSLAGMLRRIAGIVRSSDCEYRFGYAHALEQIETHLQELQRRFYAGDLAVVDEFLQLYDLTEGRDEE